MVNLTVIIVSYNTATITKNCIESITKSFGEDNKGRYEIIVVDNGSIDDSQTQILKLKVQNQNLKLKTIFNTENVGFAKANNQAVKQAQGRHLLFVNSDIIVKNVDFNKLIKLMDEDREIGVATVRVVLPNGKIDPACHRGFPTLWRSFCYFAGLEKLFGGVPLLNKIFGGYHLTYKQKNVIHEIDSPSGAFYLIKKDIFTKIKGFDERFFMYGEDLDLSYRVKKLGNKVIFYPDYEVLHLKYQAVHLPFLSLLSSLQF